eukprot:14219101-Alexandrium_andersonii.AAC.1
MCIRDRSLLAPPPQRHLISSDRQHVMVAYLMSTQWAHTTVQPMAILEIMADFELQRGALALFAEQGDSLVRP